MLLNNNTFIAHSPIKRSSMWIKLWNNIKRDKYILLLMTPVIIYYIIFHYIPMYGVTIAFKDFSMGKGIIGSEWVGFKYFQNFFTSMYFTRVLRNTVLLSLYSILWGFPVPIIFALGLNELKNGYFKRIIQTVSYLPHFISVVVVAGMIINFLSPTSGVINLIIKSYGGEPIGFLNEAKWFRTVFVASGVWQTFGWSSIIYLAAMAGIDPSLYESAVIDGCKRFQQIIYITIPNILPTIMILLLLDLGSIMNIGFEKILLLYSPLTYETSDVISTFVYRRGIIQAEYSFGAAVGVFNATINFVLLIFFNKLSKILTEISLW